LKNLGFVFVFCFVVNTSVLANAIYSLDLTQEVQEQTAPLSNEALAKRLANPVAAMISVPLQFNLDRKIGPGNSGKRYTLNIQPVVPIEINKDWNLISRTILPIVRQKNILVDTGEQTGIGDITQSFFFSPVKKTDSGWILGVGPVFLLPTASDEFLGS